MKKKLVSVVLIVAVLATVLSAFSLTAFASGRRCGDFEYTVKSGKATITKCFSKDCKIKVPDKLDGFEVTCIGKDAFKGNYRLQAIQFGRFIEKIDEDAFCGCKALKDIAWGKCLNWVGSNAFKDCPKMHIYFPGTEKQWKSICFKPGNWPIEWGCKEFECVCCDITAPWGWASATTLAAPAQTVTISLSDNAGVAGYYWGKDTDYTKNTFKGFDGKEATASDELKVTEAGTYYLVVKDTKGNVSDPVAYTFYLIQLNPLGGKVEPKEILALENTEIELPEATSKVGNTYIGWSKNILADEGDKTVTVTENALYYAVWSSKTFPDVHPDDWFFDAVKFGTKMGYIGGFEDGYFYPAKEINRQDFVLMLARIAQADLTKYEDVTLPFKDAEKGAYYYTAIAWAYQNGLVTGYTAEEFGVEDSITREQIVTILYRYMLLNHKNVIVLLEKDYLLRGFEDADQLSAFAEKAMLWAIDREVVYGKDAKTLAPVAPASRADVAMMLMRMWMKGMFL